MPTDDLMAYNAFMRGRQSMETREAEKLELAIDEFNKAVELDPEFALAWVGVADLEINLRKNNPAANHRNTA